MHWYAIRTRTNCEFRAAEHLRGENVRVWFPRAKVRTIRKTRSGPHVVWIERPQYAGYLFANLASTKFWLVRKANCRLVSLDGSEDDIPAQPTKIPDPIMTILMAGFDDDGLAFSKAETKRARFKALQRVRITDGLLKDSLAQVIADDGGETVRVLLNALGKTTVPADSLEAA